VQRQSAARGGCNGSDGNAASWPWDGTSATKKGLACFPYKDASSRDPTAFSWLRSLASPVIPFSPPSLPGLFSGVSGAGESDGAKTCQTGNPTRPRKKRKKRRTNPGIRRGQDVPNRESDEAKKKKEKKTY
jgi:hypothetical protein